MIAGSVNLDGLFDEGLSFVKIIIDDNELVYLLIIFQELLGDFFIKLNTVGTVSIAKGTRPIKGRAFHGIITNKLQIDYGFDVVIENDHEKLWVWVLRVGLDEADMLIEWGFQMGNS